jgi:exo-beta-1,3-glucanase (GH17 family)
MAAGAAAGLGAGAASMSPQNYSQSPVAPQAQGQWRPDPDYYGPPQTNITPGADNFSEAAAGGVAGIAYGVADQNPRESGLEAMRGPNYPQQTHQAQDPYGYGRGNYDYDMNDPSGGSLRPGSAAYAGDAGDRASHSSLQGLNAAAVPMAQSSPGYMSRGPGYGPGPYRDDPYQGYSVHSRQNLGTVDPNEILDDGDDGLEYHQRGARHSMLSLGHSSGKSSHNGTGAAAAAGGAAAGAGVMGAIGGLVGKKGASRDGNGHYNAVNSNTGYQGAGGSTYDLGTGPEKSAWLEKQSTSSKKLRWLFIAGILLLVAAGIALGIYFGIFRNKGSGSATAGQSAADDTADNGDLNINSPEIKKLMKNPNLHKVFPGIDYTPLNTQYPDCIHDPPSQNNVTRDVAVLSQLTNTIRLYGTDCNQTQMLIHAVNQLELKDTIKIWLGVWQDKNTTTNERQLAQMWDILDEYGEAPFKGLIVANEILFRKQMTATQLGSLLSEVRTNLTSRKISLPVATSDLGDDWTSELASMSDYIMSNIHPFFAGVNAKDAASWTYSFWSNQNGGFWKSDISKNIIAETGWPSQGGTDCGSSAVTDCPNGSVAGIDEMNTFMEGWVCQALANGTNYFWFESFDEPWKIQFNSGNQNWEDHWGLMDVNRNLKAGVKIPDCGGKTVD